MVVSDHGGGPLDGVVNLNAFLEQRGFLAYREAERRSAAVRRAVSSTCAACSPRACGPT